MRKIILLSLTMRDFTRLSFVYNKTGANFTQLLMEFGFQQVLRINALISSTSEMFHDREFYVFNTESRLIYDG